MPSTSGASLIELAKEIEALVNEAFEGDTY
jgi:hypothetical protein